MCADKILHTPVSLQSMISLTLLHTNDLHGRASQLLRIAGVVKRIKEQAAREGRVCLYLDAGDAEDTNLLESALTRGSAMNAILRAAGCDQVALGNAIPIRYGQQEIPELARFLGKPLLCANLHNQDGSIVDGLEPYRLQRIGGLDLAFIGLTAPLEFYEPFFHLNAQDPVKVLPGLVQEVRDLGAKTVIVISHIGSNVDTELADRVSGVDVIIGGHDHQVVHPPLSRGGALIAQAGDCGRFLGRLNLEIDEATGRVKHYTSELIPISEDLIEDDAAQAAFVEQHHRAQQLMNVPIGELLAPLELSFTEECSAGNMLADALLERVEGAEIGLIIPGHWSTGLDAGTVTKGSLNAALRSTGNPARVQLTGAQVEQYLCKALDPQMAARMIKPLRGNPVGYAHVAGIEVLDGNRESGQLSILMNGEPLDPQRAYVIATSDLEISEMLDYCVIPYSETQFEMPTILAEVLEDYFRQQSPCSPPGTGRIASHLIN